MIMQNQKILYSTHVDSFAKRLVKVVWPYVTGPFLFSFLPLFNKHPDRLITAIWLALTLTIIVIMSISSFKWTCNQLTEIALIGNSFKVEIMVRNTKRIFRIDRCRLKPILKWQGGRPRILKLTLFDDNKKIADFYSAGRLAMEQELEAIAYRINDVRKLPDGKCLL